MMRLLRNILAAWAIATAVMFGLLSVPAYGQTVDLSDDLEVVQISKTWIFIADRQCTSDDMVNLSAEVADSRKGFDLSEGRQYDYEAQTTNPFEVVCFPHAEIATIEITTGLMRALYPSDIFIFVFDISPELIETGTQERDFYHSTPNGMVVEKVELTSYREEYSMDYFWWRIQLLALAPYLEPEQIKNIKGVALIDLGTALVDNKGSSITHEWGHVRACAVHGVGTDDRDASTWTPYPWNDGPAPWCA